MMTGAEEAMWRLALDDKDASCLEGEAAMKNGNQRHLNYNWNYQNIFQRPKYRHLESIKQPVAMSQSPSKRFIQPNLKLKKPNFGYHSECMSPFTEKYASMRSRSAPPPPQVNHINHGNKQERSTATWKHYFQDKTVSPQKSLIKMHNILPVSDQRRRCQSVGKDFLYGGGYSKRDTTQQSRLTDEEQYISYTRLLKRLSQIVPHRIDQPYYMSGKAVHMQHRYDTDDEKLEQVKIMLRQHATRPHSRRFRERYGIGIETFEEGLDSSPLSNARNHRRKAARNKKKTNDTPHVTSPASYHQMTPLLPSPDNSNSTLVKDVEENTRFTPSPPRRPIISVSSKSTAAGDSVFLTDLNDTYGEDATGTNYMVITEKQREVFSDLFREIDVDGNGKLTFQELVDRMFCFVSKKDVKLLVKIFDVNRDKTIDEREFVAICGVNDRICGTRTEDPNASLALDLKKLSAHITLYKEIFDMIDQNRNAKLHVDEVMLLMTASVSNNTELDLKIAKEVLCNIDKDGHGYIDFVNFILFIPFFIKLHSRAVDIHSVTIRELEHAREAIREAVTEGSSAREEMKK